MAEIKETDDFQPIRIVGEYEKTDLQNNDTKIDALYGIPVKKLCRISFQLSCHPPNEWKLFFINIWKAPFSYGIDCLANWHDSQIASMMGDKVILNGTTEEQVKKYHRKTLDQVVEEANRQYQKFLKDKGERI